MHTLKQILHIVFGGKLKAPQGRGDIYELYEFGILSRQHGLHGNSATLIGKNKAKIQTLFIKASTQIEKMIAAEIMKDVSLLADVYRLN